MGSVTLPPTADPTQADLLCPGWANLTIPGPPGRPLLPLGLQDSRSLGCAPGLSVLSSPIATHCQRPSEPPVRQLCWASSAYGTLPSFETFSASQMETFTLDQTPFCLFFQRSVDVYCVPDWTLTSQGRGPPNPAHLLGVPFHPAQTGHLLVLMGTLQLCHLPSRKEDSTPRISETLSPASLL